MAADTRQFADHFELDGSNVYMEDKKLGELKDKTAVTTIDATNQFIPLQDVDGNIQKISKSSFTDAVRNVLGDLLINNDKGVSISGIPALSGSGSSLDFGSVSPANLASVLGVGKAKLTWEVTIENNATYDLEFANRVDELGGFRLFSITDGQQGKCCVVTLEWNTFTMLHDSGTYFATNFTFTVSGQTLHITNKLNRTVILSIY
jgi:hypothetical protein